jgi:hypothetical protein
VNALSFITYRPPYSRATAAAAAEVTGKLYTTRSEDDVCVHHNMSLHCGCRQLCANAASALTTGRAPLLTKRRDGTALDLICPKKQGRIKHDFCIFCVILTQ